MLILYVLTAGLVLASLVANRQKTGQALKTAGLMFLNLLPSLLGILMLVATVLAALGPETIKALLGQDSGLLGWLLAALAGSVALLPGFVAYPLAGVLAKSGVSLPILAVFLTTLMMVGLLTLPLERRYFGLKVSLVRNALSLAGALVIGLLMALYWSLT